MKKTILIVTPYRQLVGGVETVTQALAEALSSCDYDVEYLTTDELGAESFFDKIMLKIFGLPYLTANAFKKMDPMKYDHVICNGEFGYGINHVSSIVCFHGSYLGLKKFNNDKLAFKNKIALSWRAFLQVLAARNKKVVAVSEFLRDILTEQGIKTDVVIHNPIDLKKFCPIEIEKKGEYLFVGRYDYWAKGVDILEKLTDQNYDISCSFIGEATNHRLKIRPEVAYEKMNTLYNQYQILIFPSRFESFGMVAAEAMASGMPVIMRAVGLGHELKKDIPSFVINNFMDEAEMNEKIEDIKNNYDYYAKLSRKYAEKFSLITFKEQWLKILNA